MVEAATSGSTNSHHPSYEERKSELAGVGQLIPALKQSSMRAPLNRTDRDGNQIGIDRKKFRLTYIDDIERKPLVQVHCVESYKRYNAMEDFETDGEQPVSYTHLTLPTNREV